jgi:hypothetical protein
MKQDLTLAGDYLLPELVRSLAATSQELSHQVDDGGKSRACSAPWLWPGAVLAAFTLEAS